MRIQSPGLAAFTAFWIVVNWVAFVVGHGLVLPLQTSRTRGVPAPAAPAADELASAWPPSQNAVAPATTSASAAWTGARRTWRARRYRRFKFLPFQRDKTPKITGS